MAFLVNVPPCVIHEDEHLLVVAKPPGWNTHAPSAHGVDGIYDWLRSREPRWAGLSILHRLDKETSGLIVFGKTREANTSLSTQFETRRVRKRYSLLSSRRPQAEAFEVRSRLIRSGDRYLSSQSSEALEAVTRFEVAGRAGSGWMIHAYPETGRTHQIRVHASESGFPILGDLRYGGESHPRVCLHAARLEFCHPGDGQECRFESDADFNLAARGQLIGAMFRPEETDCHRLVNGISDGRPGLVVDRLSGWLLAQSEEDLAEDEIDWLRDQVREPGIRGVYHKRLDKMVRQMTKESLSPRALVGVLEGRFVMVENGLRYLASFDEGYSYGLFLDQRENRRRCLTGWVGHEFGNLFSGASRRVLNAFSYTCGYSVAAAAGGAVTLSLDLSKKYLDWGRDNFRENGLDPGAHDFIYGDAFDWLKRLGRKERRFELVMLDPPTFSQSRESGVFRAQQDYGRLVTQAVPLVESGGVIFASCNTSSMTPERFLEVVRAAICGSGRRILREQFCTQPPDFGVCKEQPAYLKTVWMRLN